MESTTAGSSHILLKPVHKLTLHLSSAVKLILTLELLPTISHLSLLTPGAPEKTRQSSSGLFSL